MRSRVRNKIVCESIRVEGAGDETIRAHDGPTFELHVRTYINAASNRFGVLRNAPHVFPGRS